MRTTLLLATMLLALPVHAATVMRQIHVESGISVLGDISFVGNGATLTGDARHTLDAVAQTMIGNPELRIEVQSSLQPDLTHAIARRRAAAVRTYLDTHGVDGRRLAARVVGAGAGIQLILQ